MESLKQPTIDIKKIQETANAAAEKAYLKEVEEYYTSYNSPYRKLIKQELEKQEFQWSMSLPKIMTKINESLEKEIDIIANNAILNSYIPMVSDTLIGLPKELKISFFLKEIIKELEPESDQFDEFNISIVKDDQYDWLNCELSTPDNYYEFVLHTVKDYNADKNKIEEKQTYQVLSFPTSKQVGKKYNSSNMIIYKDDIKIEMPFTPNILQDKVLKLFFKMMLNNSNIEIDTKEFTEDMFPEQEHCHC